MKPCKIAILSGKGGTGKTLLSVNLASVTADSMYVDCDIEEPNGHLFFNPINLETSDVTVKIPIIDKNKCDGCRLCVDFCMFNALALINNKAEVFENMCHSCGGCEKICPTNAIKEIDKVIGTIYEGKSENVITYSGFLNIKESSGVPIVKQMIENIEKYKNKVIFIDSPPGSACIVMESIKDADYCILVTESTLFGLHNLKMVHNLVKVFNKKVSVIINKDEENGLIEDYCHSSNLRILYKIPYDENLGRLNSRGLIVSKESKEYRRMFLDILSLLEIEVII